MLTTRQVLLHRLTQERSTVFHAIAFMPEAELTRPEAIGAWSVKDVLGHLAAWEDVEIGWLEQFARGERPTMDITDCDAWNAQRVAERRPWTLAETIANLIATRQRLLAVVGGMPDDIFERPGPSPMQAPFVPAILNGIADHDREHWAPMMAVKDAWIARQRQETGG